MLLLRMLLPQKFLRRPRVRLQQVPAANDLRHDLRGCDGGAPFVASVRLPQMPWMTPQLLPRQVQVRAPARVPLSTGGAIQPPEPLLEPRAA